MNLKEFDAMHSLRGARREIYKAELLDRSGVYKQDLDFLDASIYTNNDFEVKRSASIDVLDLAAINTMSDKIALYMGVYVGDVVEWYVLGTYMIVDVERNTLKLADETIRLQQDKLLDKKVFLKGSLYTDALKWFLITSNIIKFEIQQSDLVLQADIIADDSKSKLQWFNYISDQINYTHLYVDNNGYFRSERYKEPTFNYVTYKYNTGEYSIVSGVESKVDYWKVPNIFKRTVSRGDLPALVSVIINDNPSSPFSTVNRGINIVDVQTVDLISTQEELDLLTSREALKAQQVEEILKIQCINMPVHGVYDIIQVDDNLYESVSWTMKLDHRGMTDHYIKRVVFNHGLTGIK